MIYEGNLLHVGYHQQCQTDLKKKIPVYLCSLPVFCQKLGLDSDNVTTDVIWVSFFDPSHKQHIQVGFLATHAASSQSSRGSARHWATEGEACLKEWLLSSNTVYIHICNVNMPILYTMTVILFMNNKKYKNKFAYIIMHVCVCLIECTCLRLFFHFVLCSLYLN